MGRAFLFFLGLLANLLTAASAAPDSGGRPPNFLPESTIPVRDHILGKEKLIHLHFFWHNIVSGSNPTAVTVARAAVTDSSASRFGLVNVIDDPLTVGPNRASRLVGRAQGLLVSADEEVLGFLMVMNFVFADGEYNGSTLAVMGRSPPLIVREMPIIGGSGVFRFARGYVHARTHSLDRESGDALVEYNCYAAVLDFSALDNN
ncbi:hypothetical protein KSP39_PZI005402 [Platanthera zijinensis]|uniref:Dirigent protein n=1 Tax=Platanthera zijinensis TaxID=2320716 RepID=A0AAP0BRZ3_9ASPA